MEMAAEPSGELGFATPTDARGRVLLIDSNGRARSRLSQCLRPIVAELLEEAHLTRDVTARSFDLLAVNYDALSAEERDLLLELAAKRPRETRILLLANANVRSEYPRLFASGILTNLVAKNDDLAPQELLVTVRKILRSDIFGIEKYFPWGVEPLTFQIRSSRAKAEVLRVSEEYAQKLGVHSRISAHLCTVMDELVTNAVYNAPVDAEGKHRFAHLSRTTHVELEPHEEIVVKLCSDGRQLGVSVSDPFGSLSEQRVLDYLAKCFRRDDDQVDRKAGGAGLGLFYIFDALSHFIVNIAATRQTEMIGLFKLTSSYRDFVAQSKSFNIFVSP